MKNYKKVCSIIVWILLGILTLSFVMLFYRQSIRYEGRYVSDLVAHIEAGVEGRGYSLVYFILGVLYRLCGESTIGIAVFEGLVVTLTIFSVAWIANKSYLSERISMEKAIVIGIITLFASSIYVPYLYPWFYKNQFGTQAWHNITYICMRLVAIWVYYYYFKIKKEYLKKINTKDVIIFGILLVVSNLCKPSFAVIFLVMMLIELIFDFVKNGFKKMWAQLIFGGSVLPSVAIMLWQATILYNPEAESGIRLSWGQEFFYNEYFWLVKLVLAYSFQIFVLIMNWKELKRNILYSSTWLLHLIAILEYICLHETGARAAHGNFGWGRLMTDFLLMFVSICVFYDSKEKKIKYKSIGTILLLFHLISGIVYYFFLLNGANGYGI